MVHLPQLRSQCWYTIIKWSPYFIQISSVFTRCPFSVPGFCPRWYITCRHHVLRLFWVVMVSQTVFVLDDLDSLEEYWSGISRRPSVWFCLMLFHGLWVTRLRYGKKVMEGKGHSHHIISRVHAINMAYHCWLWPWSPGCSSICRASLL